MMTDMISGRPRVLWHWSRLSILIIIFLYIGMRLWRLGSFEPRADEVFSILIARLGWSELISVVAADIVHPPLFYLLLKVWVSVGGESVLWLRLFPVVTSIVSIAPILLLSRELELTAKETNIALLLLATNGFLIFYEQDIRMYSLLLLFSVTSIWLFLRLLKERANRKLLLWYVLANLLLVYTHYFGWFVFAVQCFYVLIFARRLFKPVAAIFLSLIVCFAPWAYLVFMAWRERKGFAGNLGWIESSELSDIVWFYVNLNGMLNIKNTTALGILLFCGSIVLWAWSIRKSLKDRETFWILAFFSFLPVALTFVASQFLAQSVWGARYLIIVAVPYLLLLAVAVSRLPLSWARAIVPVLLAVWATLAGLQALHPGNSRIRWSTFARELTRAKPGQAVVNVYSNDTWIADALRFSLEPFGQQFQVLVVKDIGALRGDFWLAYRDSTWLARESPQALLSQRGCVVGEQVVERRLTDNVVIMPVRCGL